MTMKISSRNEHATLSGRDEACDTTSGGLLRADDRCVASAGSIIRCQEKVGRYRKVDAVWEVAKIQKAPEAVLRQEQRGAVVVG
jgi:hypothetical protein